MTTHIPSPVLAGKKALVVGIANEHSMRRLGLYVGIDIARGPEETAFYIQAGSAWR